MRRVAACLVLLAIVGSLCPAGVLHAERQHRCCDDEDASCPLLAAAMPCCTGQPADVAPTAAAATPAPSKLAAHATAGGQADLTAALLLSARAGLDAPHGLHTLPPLLKICQRRI
jgi:hypothetical protein